MRREKRERQTEREKERDKHTRREKRESERGRQTHCPKAHPKSRKGQGGRVPCTRFFSIKISLQLPGFRKNVFMHVHGFPRENPCMNTFFVIDNFHVLSNRRPRLIFLRGPHLP